MRRLFFLTRFDLLCKKWYNKFINTLKIGRKHEVKEMTKNKIRILKVIQMFLVVVSGILVAYKMVPNYVMYWIGKHPASNSRYEELMTEGWISAGKVILLVVILLLIVDLCMKRKVKKAIEKISEERKIIFIERLRENMIEELKCAMKIEIVFIFIITVICYYFLAKCEEIFLIKSEDVSGALEISMAFIIFLYLIFAGSISSMIGLVNNFIAKEQS